MARARPPATEGQPVVDMRRVARRVALLVALAVAVVAALAVLPGIGDLRARISGADPPWVAVAAGCSLLSMLGFSVALWAAFERVGLWRGALDLGFAEQAANVVLPAGGAGGPAFGALVMRHAGVPGRVAGERHAGLFLITSLVSITAVVLAGVGVSVGLLAGDAELAWTIAPAALGVAVLGGALLLARLEPPPPAPGGRVRQAVGRVRRSLHAGMRTTLRMLRRGDRLLLLGALAYYAFDVAALAAAFEAMGGPVLPVGLFVLAYTVGHAGAFIPTPGGIGGTDGALIGAFALYGAPLALATVSVLCYRVFQLGLPIALGTLALVRLQRYMSRPTARTETSARFAALRD